MHFSRGYILLMFNEEIFFYYYATFEKRYILYCLYIYGGASSLYLCHPLLKGCPTKRELIFNWVQIKSALPSSKVYYHQNLLFINFLISLELLPAPTKYLNLVMLFFRIFDNKRGLRQFRGSNTRCAKLTINKNYRYLIIFCS